MERVCFPKLLFPVSFLTLKFTHVLENIHKGVQDMDFTHNLLWAPCREKPSAFAQLQKAMRGDCWR